MAMAMAMTSEDNKPRALHSEGMTVVCYDDKGEHIITGGENNCINVLKGLADENGRVFDENTEPVTCLATKGHRLISGCEDHVVRLFDLTKKENGYESNLTRFQAPVRCVTLNGTGSACAAGGDEMNIKIVNFADQSCKEIRGHEAPVRWLCFDPKMEFLASSSEDGTLRLWNIKTRECIAFVDNYPYVQGGADVETTGLYGFDIHPSGEYIAAAQRKYITVYDRQLEFVGQFKELGHETNVSLVRYSPNGRYLASLSVDATVIIWESSSYQSLERLRHPKGALITSIFWHPLGTELAYADNIGQVGVWKNPVRPSFKPQEAEGSTEQERQKLEAELAAKEAENDISNLFGKEGEGADGQSKKMLKKKRRTVDSDDEDEREGIESSVPVDDFIVDDENEMEHMVPAAPPAFLQPAFQPCSTPADQPRRFLSWGDVGYIVSRQEETTFAVDVEFHDTSTHRPIRLVDHFGFTMAGLSEDAFVLAAPSHAPEGEDERDHPSVLFCRNIEHWASDDSWQIFFPAGEEIEAVAIGGGQTGFVAAITDKRYVRLYSLNGVAKHVFSIEGPVVSAAASGSKLLIAYHESAALAGEQHLSCLLYDVDAKKTLARVPVPLSAGGAQLTWLGFTESGMPATCDSDETVRVLVPELDYMWSPLVDFKPLKKNPTEYYWLTSLTDTEALVVICRGGETFPKTVPKPMISAVPLSMPVVSFADTALHEEKYLRSKIVLEHSIVEEGLDELDPADRKLLIQAKKQADHHIISAISRAVQTNRSGRALDLTTFLALPSSIDTAIKLAVKAKLPLLAERMMLAKQALIKAEKERLSALKYGVSSQMDFGSNSLIRRPMGDIAMESDVSQRFSPTPSVSRHTARTRDVEEGDGGNDDDEAAMDSAADTAAPPPAPKASHRRSSGSNQTPKKAQQTPGKAVNPFAKKMPVVKSPLRKDKSFLSPSASTGGNQAGEASSPGKRKQGANWLAGFSKRSKKAQESSSSKADNKEKKKMSGYFLWLKENRKDLKAKYQGLKASELTKKAAEIWRSLPETEKAKYKVCGDRPTENADTQAQTQPDKHKSDSASAPTATQDETDTVPDTVPPPEATQDDDDSGDDDAQNEPMDTAENDLESVPPTQSLPATDPASKASSLDKLEAFRA